MIKAIKTFFDSSEFDEVGDAMDLWWNTIQNSFEFDALKDKTTFFAVVLTPPVPLSSDGIENFLGIGDGSEDTMPKFTFKARILGELSPHRFWPDPCDPKFVSEVGGQKEALEWILKHTDVVGKSGNDTVMVGDTVRIELSLNIFTVDAGYATLIDVVQNLQSISDTKLRQAASKECAEPLTTLFDNMLFRAPSSPTSTPVASNAAEFIDYLRKSGFFPLAEFTDEFLAGLAANAYQESRFLVPNPGDPVSYYITLFNDGKITQTKLDEVKSEAIESYCSWGLFQLNICGGAGEGYMNKYGYFHPLSEAQKIDLYDELLSNPDKQIEYVALYSKNTLNDQGRALNAIRNDPKISAQQAGEFIATYFERCAGCKKTTNFPFPAGHSKGSSSSRETKARGILAETYLKEYYTAYPPTSSTTPPATATPPSSPTTSTP